MKKSSFGRYCEYRGNRATYSLLESIPVVVISFVFITWIIKAAVLLLMICLVVFCISRIWKSCRHNKKKAKALDTVDSL